MELKLIFLIILGVVSIVYLITLFFKDSILQFILKGCLVPLILAVYLTGVNTILLPIILALVFGWLGDIFLLKISNLLRFRLGLASFLLGHIFYIIIMFPYTMPFNILILIISILVAACYGIFIFRFIQPTKEMKIPVIAYEVIIFTMAIFALQLFLSQGGKFGALVFAGSICFVASDSLLSIATFRKKALNVPVMITYIAAQLLITLGFGVM
ncbi:lysoplasmalogenase [Treponema sp. R6D11]